MDNATENRELDLVDIIKIFWGWIVKFIFSPIVFLLRFSLKNWKQLMCFVILGIAASVCYWLILPKYQTIAIYENNVGISGDYITRINLEKTTSIENISANMNISIDVAKNLQIKPHYIYFKDSTLNDYYIDFKDKKTSKYIDGSRFCVEFISKDKSYLQNIELSILNMFCNNTFYNSKNQQRLGELQSQVEFAVSESSILDSLRSVKFKETGNVEAFKLSNKGFLTTSDPMSYSKELMRLNEIKTASESKLNYNRDVLRLSFVAHPDKPKNFIIKTIVPFTFSAIVLGLLVLLCLRFKSEIKDFINK